MPEVQQETWRCCEGILEDVIRIRDERTGLEGLAMHVDQSRTAVYPRCNGSERVAQGTDPGDAHCKATAGKKIPTLHDPIYSLPRARTCSVALRPRADSAYPPSSEDTIRP